MSKLYQYFVEGECEEKLINILKNPKYNCIVAGKISVCNFINKRISDMQIMNLKPNVNIILVYDTDVEKTDVLNENIAKLRKHKIKNIYHIHSVKDFEDEIIYSTSINNINEFFDTKTKSDFKNKFIKANSEGLKTKLDSLNFDNDKLWSRQGKGCFKEFSTKQGIKVIKNKHV